MILSLCEGLIGGCSAPEKSTLSAKPDPAKTYPSIAAKLEAMAGRASLDYADPDMWGCVGDEGICATPQTFSSMSTDGSLISTTLTADASAEVDCFYLYPTVSWQEAAGNDDDLDLKETARATMESQAAPFAGACKVYAPFYRQVTLLTYTADPALAAPLFRNSMVDVASAFEYYLAHWNQGRPLVIIGHSQGAQMGSMLLHLYFDGVSDVTQIEGSRTSVELRKRLVMGLPLGFNVYVPKGKKVGGSFSDLPLCAADDDVGCVMHYRSFPERPAYPTLTGNSWSGDQILVNEGFFNRPFNAKTDEVACVNPAVGAALAPEEVTDSAGKIVLPGDIRLLTGSNFHLAMSTDEGFGMFFDADGFAAPGRYAATCRGGYLGIGLHVPATGLDARGDPATMGAYRFVLTGLHTFDAHIAQGDLVQQVIRRTKAWRDRQ